MIEPKTYKEVQEAVEKWFDENIDQVLLKELRNRPVSPALKEMIKKATLLSFGAYIKIPEEKND